MEIDFFGALLEEALEEAVETLDGHGGDVLPPAPKLTAEKTVAMRTQYEDLRREEENVFGPLWQQYETADTAETMTFEREKVNMFAPGPTLTRVDVQRMLVLLEEARMSSKAAVQQVRTMHEEVLVHRDVLDAQLFDVLIHRPAQHALLDPAHPVIQVQVQTPTLGPVISDAEMLQQVNGLDLTSR